MAIGSVLFAAGRGTRLRPLTERTPKPALPVLDVPLASFSLALLRRTRPPVIVNLSRGAEVVRAALAPWAAPDVEYAIERPAPFGTAGTLGALRPRLAPTVLTCNADVLTDLEPSALLAAHERLGSAATVAVAPVTAGADFDLAGERVAELIDRRASPRRAGWVFTGVTVLERDAVTDVARPSGLVEAVLRPLIARREVAAVVHDGYFMDVGTPERYLQSSLDVLAGRLRLEQMPGAVVATRDGRAYVGPGTTVQGALGRGAIVLRGAVVERGAHVERAIVWPWERVPAKKRVVDTVFAPSTGYRGA